MIDALIRSAGIKLGAARILDCSTKTIQRYCTRYPKVEEAVLEATEDIKDLAESKLIEAIGKGEAWAVCFFLKTRAKDRGYVERAPTKPGEGGERDINIIIKGGLPAEPPPPREDEGV